jgi:hypothetical protein
MGYDVYVTIDPRDDESRRKCAGELEILSAEGAVDDNWLMREAHPNDVSTHFKNWALVVGYIVSLGGKDYIEKITIVPDEKKDKKEIPKPVFKGLARKFPKTRSSVKTDGL